MTRGLEQTGALLSRNGVRLMYREWLVERPRGALVIAHGLGEHSGRYAHLALRLNAIGIAVRAHDFRGHGQSQGERGALSSRLDLLDDLKLMLDDFAAHTEEVPFLLGHSLGGLVAARFATGNISPLRGLVLSSPALAFRMRVSQRILLAVASVVAPSMKAPNRLELNYLSHDATVVAAYRSDSLVHGVATPRLIRFMEDAIEETMAAAPSLRIPVLMQVAGDDHLVDASGSKAWFGRLAPGVGTMHWYDDAYHEIYNESVERRARVLADLSAWLSARLA